MKNRIKLLLLSLTLSFSMFSQTELSVNVSNMLINEACFTYEKGINDYLSVGGFVSYMYGLPPTDNREFLNTSFYFGPEVKYYVSPKNGIDRFYIGFYLKESIGTVGLNENYYYNYYGNSGELSPGASSAYSKLAFGFQLGSKWVAKNNLIYGLHFGFGRNLYAQYDNQTVRDYYYNNNGAAENFDFRFGFNLGFRFK